MEESYETFEEDSQRPSRLICRPDIYAARKLKEEMASVPLQIKAEPKILVRETSFNRSASMPQTVSTQNASQPEVPWESVTLNRCLFIAITILVLTSGFQRLHEALHGHKVTLDEEEDQYALIMRRSGGLRHRTEPEVTLWDVIFSWLPDLDDDDDDDDEEEEEEEDEVRVLRKRKPKRRRVVKTLSGLRNRPIPDKLLKHRDGQSKVRQAKKLVQQNVDSGETGDDQDDNVENVENVEKEAKKALVGKKKPKEN